MVATTDTETNVVTFVLVYGRGGSPREVKLRITSDLATKIIDARQRGLTVNFTGQDANSNPFLVNIGPRSDLQAMFVE